MEEKKSSMVWRRVKSLIPGDKLILIVALIIVVAIFTSLNSNYLSWTNFVNILVAASLIGLVAIGHTYLIIAGQNDLSPGSVAAFSGVLGATLVSLGLPFLLAVVITLLAGVVIGFFNAWMVNKIKIEAFIATLVLAPEGQRRVKIDLYSNDNYLIIYIANSFDAKADVKQMLSMERSTKRDAARHGYGHRIVKNIVQKYDGDILYTVEGGLFVAKAMLALHDAKSLPGGKK